MSGSDSGRSAVSVATTVKTEDTGKSNSDGGEPPKKNSKGSKGGSDSDNGPEKQITAQLLALLNKSKKSIEDHNDGKEFVSTCNRLEDQIEYFLRASIDSKVSDESAELHRKFKDFKEEYRRVNVLEDSTRNMNYYMVRDWDYEFRDHAYETLRKADSYAKEITGEMARCRDEMAKVQLNKEFVIQLLTFCGERLNDIRKKQTGLALKIVQFYRYYRVILKRMYEERFATVMKRVHPTGEPATLAPRDPDGLEWSMLRDMSRGMNSEDSFDEYSEEEESSDSGASRTSADTTATATTATTVTRRSKKKSRKSKKGSDSGSSVDHSLDFVVKKKPEMRLLKKDEVPGKQREDKDFERYEDAQEEESQRMLGIIFYYLQDAMNRYTDLIRRSRAELDAFATSTIDACRGIQINDEVEEAWNEFKGKDDYFDNSVKSDNEIAELVRVVNVDLCQTRHRYLNDRLHIVKTRVKNLNLIVNYYQKLERKAKESNKRNSEIWANQLDYEQMRLFRVQTEHMENRQELNSLMFDTQPFEAYLGMMKEHLQAYCEKMLDLPESLIEEFELANQSLNNAIASANHKEEQVDYIELKSNLKPSEAAHNVKRLNALREDLVLENRRKQSFEQMVLQRKRQITSLLEKLDVRLNVELFRIQNRDAIKKSLEVLKFPDVSIPEDLDNTLPNEDMVTEQLSKLNAIRTLLVTAVETSQRSQRELYERQLQVSQEKLQDRLDQLQQEKAELEKVDRKSRDTSDYRKREQKFEWNVLVESAKLNLFRKKAPIIRNFINDSKESSVLTDRLDKFWITPVDDAFSKLISDLDAHRNEFNGAKQRAKFKALEDLRKLYNKALQDARSAEQEKMIERRNWYRERRLQISQEERTMEATNNATLDALSEKLSGLFSSGESDPLDMGEAPKTGCKAKCAPCIKRYETSKREGVLGWWKNHNCWRILLYLIFFVAATVGMFVWYVGTSGAVIIHIANASEALEIQVEACRISFVPCDMQPQLFLSGINPDKYTCNTIDLHSYRPQEHFSYDSTTHVVSIKNPPGSSKSKTTSSATVDPYRNNLCRIVVTTPPGPLNRDVKIFTESTYLVEVDGDLDLGTGSFSIYAPAPSLVMVNMNTLQAVNVGITSGSGTVSIARLDANATIIDGGSSDISVVTPNAIEVDMTTSNKDGICIGAAASSASSLLMAGSSYFSSSSDMVSRSFSLFPTATVGTATSTLRINTTVGYVSINSAVPGGDASSYFASANYSNGDIFSAVDRAYVTSVLTYQTTVNATFDEVMLAFNAIGPGTANGTFYWSSSRRYLVFPPDLVQLISVGLLVPYMSYGRPVGLRNLQCPWNGAAIAVSEDPSSSDSKASSTLFPTVLRLKTEFDKLRSGGQLGYLGNRTCITLFDLNSQGTSLTASCSTIIGEGSLTYVLILTAVLAALLGLATLFGVSWFVYLPRIRSYRRNLVANHKFHVRKKLGRAMTIDEEDNLAQWISQNTTPFFMFELLFPHAPVEELHVDRIIYGTTSHKWFVSFVVVIAHFVMVFLPALPVFIAVAVFRDVSTDMGFMEANRRNVLTAGVVIWVTYAAMASLQLLWYYFTVRTRKFQPDIAEITDKTRADVRPTTRRGCPCRKQQATVEPEAVKPVLSGHGGSNSGEMDDVFIDENITFLDIQNLDQETERPKTRILLDNSVSFGRKLWNGVYILVLGLMGLISLIYTFAVVLWIILGIFVNPNGAIPVAIAIAVVVSHVLTLQGRLGVYLKKLMTELDDTVREVLDRMELARAIGDFNILAEGGGLSALAAHKMNKIDINSNTFEIALKKGFMPGSLRTKLIDAGVRVGLLLCSAVGAIRVFSAIRRDEWTSSGLRTEVESVAGYNMFELKLALRSGLATPNQISQLHRMCVNTALLDGAIFDILRRLRPYVTANPAPKTELEEELTKFLSDDTNIKDDNIVSKLEVQLSEGYVTADVKKQLHERGVNTATLDENLFARIQVADFIPAVHERALVNKGIDVKRLQLQIRTNAVTQKTDAQINRVLGIKADKLREEMENYLPPLLKRDLNLNKIPAPLLKQYLRNGYIPVEVHRALFKSCKFETEFFSRRILDSIKFADGGVTAPEEVISQLRACESLMSTAQKKKKGSSSDEENEEKTQKPFTLNRLQGYLLGGYIPPPITIALARAGVFTAVLERSPWAQLRYPGFAGVNSEFEPYRTHHFGHLLAKQSDVENDFIAQRNFEKPDAFEVGLDVSWFSRSNNRGGQLGKIRNGFIMTQGWHAMNFMDPTSLMQYVRAGMMPGHLLRHFVQNDTGPEAFLLTGDVLSALDNEGVKFVNAMFKKDGRFEPTLKRLTSLGVDLAELRQLLLFDYRKPDGSTAGTRAGGEEADEEDPFGGMHVGSESEEESSEKSESPQTRPVGPTEPLHRRALQEWITIQRNKTEKRFYVRPELMWKLEEAGVNTIRLQERFFRTLSTMSADDVDKDPEFKELLRAGQIDFELLVTQLQAGVVTADMRARLQAVGVDTTLISSEAGALNQMRANYFTPLVIQRLKAAKVEVYDAFKAVMQRPYARFATMPEGGEEPYDGPTKDLLRTIRDKAFIDTSMLLGLADLDSSSVEWNQISLDGSSQRNDDSKQAQKKHDAESDEEEKQQKKGTVQPLFKDAEGVLGRTDRTVHAARTSENQRASNEERNAVGQMVREIVERILAVFGISQRSIAISLLASTLILLIILLFLFVGISAFSDGSAVATAINSVLVLVAGGGVNATQRPKKQAAANSQRFSQFAATHIDSLI